MIVKFAFVFQFDRNSGKGSEEVDMWIAYCHFHLGEYQKAMKVNTMSTVFPLNPTTLFKLSVSSPSSSIGFSRQRISTADFPSPSGPTFCILLHHFNHCHVLSQAASIYIRFSLPCFLFPGSSILSILPPIYPPSFLRIIKHQFNLTNTFSLSPNKKDLRCL